MIWSSGAEEERWNSSGGIVLAVDEKEGFGLTVTEKGRKRF